MTYTPSTKLSLRFRLNGEERKTECFPSDNLIEVLRDSFGLMSVKRGCDFGGCGMCTVLLEGKPVYSCMTPAWRVSQKAIETIEGISVISELAKQSKNDMGIRKPKLSALQEAFVSNFAQQCGYCTPAMILCASALLSNEPHPSSEQIKDSISGVLCRCTGYIPIVNAIMQAANTNLT